MSPEAVRPAYSGIGSPANSTVRTASFFTGAGLNVPALATLIRDEGHVQVGVDGRLYRYEGGVYCPDGNDFARVRTRELLGDSWRRRHVEEVVAYLRAQYPTIDTMSPESLINVRNGLLDWKALELRDHDPSIASVNQIPIDWAPDATCPRFEKFAAEVIPEDAIDFLFEILGYAMLTRNPHRVAVLLLGPGRNGKSVLLRVIRSLVGERNVSAVPLQALAENRFAAAGLFGKLANVCGDLDARAIRQTDTFKMLTGGDELHAERKHRDPFSFVSYALPLFSANEAPLSSDQTGAWCDRWVILPMEKRITTREVNTHLGAELTAPGELEGILVRSIVGLRTLMERGRFAFPPSVDEAGKRYRAHVDTVQAFLDEMCVANPEFWTPRPLLYKEYRQWAVSSGRMQVSPQSFNKQVRLAFDGGVAERTRRGTVGWLGLGLASDVPE